MKKDAQNELRAHVTISKRQRARRFIMEELDSSHADEFSTLEAYCTELH